VDTVIKVRPDLAPANGPCRPIKAYCECDNVFLNANVKMGTRIFIDRGAFERVTEGNSTDPVRVVLNAFMLNGKRNTSF
jgi:hypothetical protein